MNSHTPHLGGVEAGQAARVCRGAGHFVGDWIHWIEVCGVVAHHEPQATPPVGFMRDEIERKADRLPGADAMKQT
jgi:hypothetical protein